jgi:hypothetical protein
MEELRQLEVRNYRAALKRAGGKIYGAGGAAALMGLPATTLSSRMKALSIDTSSRSSPDHNCHASRECCSRTGGPSVVSIEDKAFPIEA